jgi:uncharacterized membrane protein
MRKAPLIAGLLAMSALASCDNQNKAPTGAPAGGEVGQPAAQIAPEDLGAPASAEVQALYTGEFEAAAMGEPFWQLVLLNDYASFERPGLSEAGGMPSQRDYRAQGARVIAGPLTIVLKFAQCTRDTGETFPYQAIVQFEGVSYEGCARRGGSASSDWTSSIAPLMPSIDACLGKVEKKPARVTIAYVDGDGMPSVRLLDAEGGRYECKTAPAGGAPTSWETIADRDVLEGERDPMFVRAPGTAPAATSCVTVTEAKSSAGKLLGWYTSRKC